MPKIDGSSPVTTQTFTVIEDSPTSQAVNPDSHLSQQDLASLLKETGIVDLAAVKSDCQAYKKLDPDLFLDFNNLSIFDIVRDNCFATIEQKKIFEALRKAYLLINYSSQKCNGTLPYDGTTYYNLNYLDSAYIVGSTAWKILSQDYNIFKQIFTQFFIDNAITSDKSEPLLKRAFEKLKQNPYLNHTELDIRIVCYGVNTQQPWLLGKIITEDLVKEGIKLEYKVKTYDESQLVSFELKDNKRVEIYISQGEPKPILCSKNSKISFGDGHIIFSSSSSLKEILAYLLSDIDVPNLENPRSLARYFMNNKTILSTGYLEPLIENVLNESTDKDFDITSFESLELTYKNYFKCQDQLSKGILAYLYLKSDLQKKLRYSTAIEKEYEIQKRFSLVWNSLHTFMHYQQIDDKSAVMILSLIKKDHLLKDLEHIPLLKLLLNCASTRTNDGYTCSDLFSIVEIFAFIYMPKCANNCQEPLHFVIKNKLDIKFPANFVKSLEIFTNYVTKCASFNLVEKLQQIFCEASGQLGKINPKAHKTCLSNLDKSHTQALVENISSLMDSENGFIALLGANIQLACQSYLTEKGWIFRVEYNTKHIPKFISCNNSLVKNFYLNFCAINKLKLIENFDHSKEQEWLNLFINHKFNDAARSIWEQNPALYDKKAALNIFYSYKDSHSIEKALMFLLANIENIFPNFNYLLDFLDNNLKILNSITKNQINTKILNPVIKFIVAKNDAAHTKKLIDLFLKFDDKSVAIRLALQEILKRKISLASLEPELANLLFEVMPILLLNQYKNLHFSEQTVKIITNIATTSGFSTANSPELSLVRLCGWYHSPFSNLNFQEFNDELEAVLKSNIDLVETSQHLNTIFRNHPDKTCSKEDFKNYIDNLRKLAGNKQKFINHKSTSIRAALENLIEQPKENKFLIEKLACQLINLYNIDIDKSLLEVEKSSTWAKILGLTYEKDNIVFFNKIRIILNQPIEYETASILIDAAIKVNLDFADSLLISWWDNKDLDSQALSNQDFVNLLIKLSLHYQKFPAGIEKVFLHFVKADKFQKELATVRANLNIVPTHYKIIKLSKVESKNESNHLDITEILADEIIAYNTTNLDFDEDERYQIAMNLCDQIIKSQIKNLQLSFKLLYLAVSFSKDERFAAFGLLLISKKIYPKLQHTDKLEDKDTPKLPPFFIEVLEKIASFPGIILHEQLCYFTLFTQLKTLNLIQEPKLELFLEKLISAAMPNDKLKVLDICSNIIESKQAFSAHFASVLLNKYIEMCDEDFTEIEKIILKLSNNKSILTVYGCNYEKAQKLINKMAISEFESSIFTNFLLSNSLIKYLNIENFSKLLETIEFDQFVTDRIWLICEGIISYHKQPWKPHIKNLNLISKYNQLLKLLINDIYNSDHTDQHKDLLTLINIFCDSNNSQLVTDVYLTFIEKISKHNNLIPNVYKFLFKPVGLSNASPQTICKFFDLMIHYLNKDNIKGFIEIFKKHDKFNFYFSKIVNKVINQNIKTNKKLVIEYIENSERWQHNSNELLTRAYYSILKDTEFRDKAYQWFLNLPTSFQSLYSIDRKKMLEIMYQISSTKNLTPNDPNLKSFKQSKFQYLVGINKIVEALPILNELDETFIIKLPIRHQSAIGCHLINNIREDTKFSPKETSLIYNLIEKTLKKKNIYTVFEEKINENIGELIKRGLIDLNYPIVKEKIEATLESCYDSFLNVKNSKKVNLANLNKYITYFHYWNKIVTSLTSSDNSGSSASFSSAVDSSATNATAIHSDQTLPDVNSCSNNNNLYDELKTVRGNYLSKIFSQMYIIFSSSVTCHENTALALLVPFNSFDLEYFDHCVEVFKLFVYGVYQVKGDIDSTLVTTIVEDITSILDTNLKEKNHELNFDKLENIILNLTSLICGTNFLNCKSGAVNYEPIIDKIFKIEQLLKSKQKKSIDSTDSSYIFTSLDKSQDKTLFGVSPFSHWDYSSLTDAKAVWQKSNQQIDKVLSDLNNKLSLNQESFYNNLSCLYQGNNSCYFWSAQVVVHCFILNEEIDEKSCMEVFRKFHFDHPLKAKYLPFLKLLFTMKSFTQNNKSDNIKNFLQSSKEWV